MALTQIKDYTHLITQDGNYVYLLDEDQNNVSTINWAPLFPYTRANTVDCIVWIDRANPATININFRDETKKFLGTVNVDYDIYIYAVSKHITSNPYVIGDIVWLNEACWYCLANTSTTPSLSNPTWIQIDESNTDYFIGYDTDVANTYMYRPIFSAAYGNISVIKTGDHEFNVYWLGSGTIESYVAKNYAGAQEDIGIVNNTEFEITFDTDGVYYIELTMDDASVQFVEIYDLTDAEKCYLNLMKTVLCDCVDCNDCPGAKYERALNYVNTYQLLRDMIFSDQAQRVGLVSTDTLRQEYLQSIGLMVEKLKILTTQCTCSDQN